MLTPRQEAYNDMVEVAGDTGSPASGMREAARIFRLLIVSTPSGIERDIYMGSKEALEDMLRVR